jgi:hypothetical protein
MTRYTAGWLLLVLWTGSTAGCVSVTSDVPGKPVKGEDDVWARWWVKDTEPAQEETYGIRPGMPVEEARRIAASLVAEGRRCLPPGGFTGGGAMELWPLDGGRTLFISHNWKTVTDVRVVQNESE